MITVTISKETFLAQQFDLFNTTQTLIDLLKGQCLVHIDILAPLVQFMSRETKIYQQNHAQPCRYKKGQQRMRTQQHDEQTNNDNHLGQDVKQLQHDTLHQDLNKPQIPLKLRETYLQMKTVRAHQVRPKKLVHEHGLLFENKTGLSKTDEQ